MASCRAAWRRQRPLRVTPTQRTHRLVRLPWHSRRPWDLEPTGAARSSSSALGHGVGDVVMVRLPRDGGASRSRRAEVQARRPRAEAGLFRRRTRCRTGGQAESRRGATGPAARGRVAARRCRFRRDRVGRSGELPCVQLGVVEDAAANSEVREQRESLGVWGADRATDLNGCARLDLLDRLADAVQLPLDAADQSYLITAV